MYGLTDATRDQTPVITRLQGGVGNQLYQYAIGRAVASRLERPLLIDARTIRPEAPVRQYALSAFRIRGVLVSGSIAFCTRWVGSVRLGGAFQATFPPARRFRYLRDREEGFDPKVFAMHPGPIVLHGYWQSYRYFEDIAPLLRADLEFHVTPDVENARWIAHIESVEAVCVHVRRGDYVSNPNFAATLGSCTPEYYRRGVAAILKRSKRPEFFVFSDDPAWARGNLRLPGRTHILEHNLRRSDVDDMRLMSHCRHFIIANSSFSWWAAWLSRRPGKSVIAPARWFVQDKTPSVDRIPPDWVRV